MIRELWVLPIELLIVESQLCTLSHVIRRSRVDFRTTVLNVVAAAAHWRVPLSRVEDENVPTTAKRHTTLPHHRTTRVVRGELEVRILPVHITRTKTILSFLSYVYFLFEIVLRIRQTRN